MNARDIAVKMGIEAGSMLYDRNRKDGSQLGFLYDLAEQAPDGDALEVGVLNGGSLITWAQARIMRGDLYAIDDWSHKTASKDTFLMNIGKHGLVVHWFSGKSWLCRAVPNNLAFCFIDGDHSYKGVPHDVAVWPDKMMPGGIIAFHDYGTPNPRQVVKCIVDAWQHDYQWIYVGTVGSTIAFRRPIA